jgi:membrane protease YdiL (CAAX protease family)
MGSEKAVRDAVVFSGITLGLSYLVFWGPLAVFHVPAISFVGNVRGPTWAVLLFLLGGFVPSAVAIILTAIPEGTKGLGSLLKRFTQFNLGLQWYLAILLVVLVGAAGQILINSLLGHTFNPALYLSQLPSLLPLLILGPVSEEFGWRGYLLTKLQSKWSPLTSSLIVGLVWGLWHLPLFYMVGTSQHELHLPFMGFLVGMVAVSTLMTWTNNSTRGSLWTAIIFHWLYTYASQVSASGVARSPLYNWLEYLPYVIMAAIVVLIWKPQTLSRPQNTLGYTESRSASSDGAH